MQKQKKICRMKRFLLVEARPSFNLHPLQELLLPKTSAPQIYLIFSGPQLGPSAISTKHATDAMFDALNKFLMKMKEVDCQLTVFPHNLSQYGTLNNLPHIIDKPEDLPTEVND